MKKKPPIPIKDKPVPKEKVIEDKPIPSTRSKVRVQSPSPELTTLELSRCYCDDLYD